MLRVTRPGGRLVICEFGHLPGRRLNALYERYLAAALPLVARRLSGNAAAYNYLAESIADWPAQPELARRIGAAGWRAVRWRNLTMGVVAVHTARRPGPSPDAGAAAIPARRRVADHEPQAARGGETGLPAGDSGLAGGTE